MRVSGFFVLMFCIASGFVGQQSLYAQTNPEERIARILKTLEPDNTLRLALEDGTRGKGVHEPWMDKMQAFQVKQAWFTIDFTWFNGVESLKITDVRYLRTYYRYDSAIKDQKTLDELHSGRLEQDLRAAALSRAIDHVLAIIEGVQRSANVNPKKAHGTLYVNLLDDEILPALVEMPEVDW
jgi:hypothetical protein